MAQAPSHCYLCGKPLTGPTNVDHVPPKLFSDLDKRDLENLASLFKERTFGAGDTVSEEGQTGIGFFVIADAFASSLR